MLTCTTVTGRVIDLPKVGKLTPRTAMKRIKQIDEWLVDQAIAEADSRDDDYAKTLFGSELPVSKKGLPQASRDCLNEYLFGDVDGVDIPMNTK